MMRKIRRAMSEKKGFTLVELVVVLVILAILAALLMPSLTGYIDKAKEKRVVAEVHQVVTAAQSLADEAYALAANDPTADTYVDAITLDAVAGLAEVKGGLEDVRIKIDTGKHMHFAMPTCLKNFLVIAGINQVTGKAPPVVFRNTDLSKHHKAVTFV